jgi:serine/threonine-protein kinase
MEYINGIDLTDLLRFAVREKKPIPIRVALALVHGAALGLDHAHRATTEEGKPRGIIHRDVSPQNLMARLDGLVKVVDFGIAHAADQLYVTNAKGVQGKIGYMSPEQIAGSKLDSRTDQFSLGIVLWELLTRRRLFKGDNPAQVFRRILQDQPDPPSRVRSEIPAEVDAIVVRMLHRQVDGRFPSAGDAAAAIANVLASTGGVAAQAEIARFVTELVGDRVAERTRDLTPAADISIEGLGGSDVVRCARCGGKNSAFNRFCGECGAMLATESGRSKAKREAIESSLAEHAAQLSAMLAGERRMVTVLEGRFLGREALRAHYDNETVRALENRILHSLHRVAESHEALVDVLSPDRFSLIFGALRAFPKDVERAMECAKDMTEVLATMSSGAPSSLGLAAGIESGPAIVIASAANRPKVEGPVRTAAATVLAQAVAGGPGAIRIGPAARERRVRVGEATRPSAPAMPGVVPHAAAESFVGREDDLAMIEADLEEVVAGRSHARLWFGESGVGKSALIAQGARRASELGFELADLSGQRGALSAANELLRRLVRGLLKDPEQASESIGRAGIERIEKLFEHDAELEESNAKEQKLRSDAALLGLVRARTEARPLCIVIDDLQFADPSSIEFILGLTAREDLGRLYLLLSASEELAKATPGIATALAPLEATEVVELAARRLLGGQTMPPAAAARLSEDASGNPALALELLASLIERGLLHRNGGIWTITGELSSVALPSALIDFLEARIDRLSLRARAFLRVGAVMGPTFSIPMAAGALAIAKSEPVLEECLASGLVVTTGDASTLRFAREAARERVLERIVEQDLRDIHLRLAQVIERDASPSAANRLELVARHLLLAQAGLRAIPLVANALERLRRAGAVRSAAVLLQNGLTEAERALAAGVEASDEELASLYRVLALLATFSTEDPRARLEWIQRFLERMDPVRLPHARAEVLRDRARLQLERSHLAEANHDLEAALSLAGEDVELRASIRSVLAQVHEARGQLAESARLLTESLTEMAARPATNRHFYWESLNALGRHHLKMGQIELAEELFTNAEQQANLVGSGIGASKALTNLAAAAAQAGHVERALGVLDQAMSLARDGADAIGQARILYNRGCMMLGAGRRADAETALDQAIRVAREAGWSEGLALAIAAKESMHRAS